MADTMDRRSEGRNGTPAARADRRLREGRRSRGLCTRCGTAAVGRNRSWCYGCVDAHRLYAARSGLRWLAEVDPVGFEALVREVWKKVPTWVKTSRKRRPL